MDKINIWTISSSISTFVMAFCAVINVILTISILKKDKKEKDNNSHIDYNELGLEMDKKEDTNIENKRKIRPEFYFIFASLFLIIVLSIMQLLLNNDKIKNHETSHTQGGRGSICVNTKQIKDTLLVFAGGGSVRNLLLEEVDSLDVRSYPHSINIAIASGSAWRVLAEEYQLRQTDNDSINRFTTICLSAGEMSKEFYQEYMSSMENTIVAEVYLGNDKLVAYISDSLASDWNIPISANKVSEVSLDFLAQKLYKYLIESNQENKISIFTTNKTSGSLETYKMYFNDIKKRQDSITLLEFKNKLDIMELDDSTRMIRYNNISDSLKKTDFINLEEKIENKQVYIYYDNMIAEQITNKAVNGRYLILGSEHYYVKGLENIKLYLKDSNNKLIHKSMYLYFLAHKQNKQSNEFIIEKSILDFLNLEKMKKIPISKENKHKWKNNILKKGVIYYDIPASNDSKKPIRIN